MKFPVVGAAEIAEMLGGLSRQRVSQLTADKDFPAPLAKLAMGSVWRFEDVRAWAERTGLMAYLKVDSRPDRLRADPRFARRLRRAGLASKWNE